MSQERKILRALLSVTEKSGIVDFARDLRSCGVGLISTGGTARAIREAGILVTEVADVTGFPEMLDGRVKTIHPRIAGGILARRDVEAHMSALSAHDIPLIDLVVVNLYQFEQTAARSDVTVPELVENIDIGGQTMIRAAAKNYQDVAVVVDPADYGDILDEMLAAGELSIETRWQLAQKAFSLTAAYDRAISRTLACITYGHGESGPVRQTDAPTTLPQRLDLLLPRKALMRYGENPHQQAALYASGHAGVANAAQLGGKEMSYNNYVDADAAWQLVREFACDSPACAIIKHTNPCGCAVDPKQAEAYRKALSADPISAFGSVVAFNATVDADTAMAMCDLFIEVVVAPDYDDTALGIFLSKKGLRILRVVAEEPGMVIKAISGGVLVQTPDRLLESEVDEAALVTQREPTAEEWQGLRFAWKVVKHVKSNAIVYARGRQLLGLGAGQPNRVNSAKIGAQFAVLPLAGCICASDAFFPFPDGVEAALAAGATAFVQPGGSRNDKLAIDAANAAGAAMLFTGFRHFRH